MDLKARMSRFKSDGAAAPSEEATVTPIAVQDPPEYEWNDEELSWKDKLYKRLLKVMDLSLLASMQEREAKQQIREILQRLMVEESVPLNSVSRQRLVKGIEDEILGLGPLEPLLADPSISDILVNGSKCCYVERAGKLHRTNVRFDSDAHLMNIIDRIVSNVGRRIDESSPMVDARLKDGSRVNAIVPPLAIDGPVLSIRRFRTDMLSIDDLVRLGSLAPAMSEILEQIVRSQLNVIVSGGTGSGKTTLLNILSGFVPDGERIVTIEDSAELQLRQLHVVRLETRPPNIEGKGEVTQRDLVRNSLRMRPDRIVLGEVRGAEALDMLQAMNTGHDGSLTTIHANAPRDALGRVENMVAMTGLNLPISAVRPQIASAIDVVLQTERQEDGCRRIVSIQEVNGMEGDIITMSEIFRFNRQGVDENGNVLGDFRATGIMPRLIDRLAERGLSLDPTLFDPNRSHKPGADARG
jgi:pilus assembly protein CpaF